MIGMIKKASILVTLVLVTLRLTRFVTQDWLGEWTIARPAKAWALEKAGYIERTADGGWTQDPGEVWTSIDVHNDPSKAVRLVSGLDCPFCVGQWIAALVLAVLPLSKVPGVGRLVRYAASALALNYITGHISSRID